MPLSDTARSIHVIAAVVVFKSENSLSLRTQRLFLYTRDG